MSALPSGKMTVDEFMQWADRQSTDDRWELMDGIPVVAMAPESFRHGETKLAAVLALRQAIARSGLDCRAFVDSVSVRINDHSARTPDASVQCGAVQLDDYWLTNPVVIVEVVSRRSGRRDGEEKLIDYFAVPSVVHYLILYPDERKIVHHRRGAMPGEIATWILNEGSVDLSPPGITVSVEALLGAEDRVRQE